MAGSERLDLAEPRVILPAAAAERRAAAILVAAGFDAACAAEVAAHLVDAEACGVESHGIVRVLQYVDQVRSGVLDGVAAPVLVAAPRGGSAVDGCGGIGIPALRLAVDHAAARARETGMAVVPVRHVGHTGRLGAFAERAAEAGAFCLIVGGGGRQNWRQAAPHGGRRAVLPTNPWCMASPGGARGPVVVDFATSMIAGGWLHAARAAGALVPEGAIIDADGRSSRDPEAYFAGGAILPKGGPMGYGLAVMAEMICEAMLGPVSTECNWLVLALDAAQWRDGGAVRDAAEAVLAELRDCPPAPGVARVEVPGERERALRARRLAEGLPIPARTCARLDALARQLGVAGP